MILITGGFAQGKRAYIEEKYKGFSGEVIYLNKLAKEMFDDGQDPIVYLTKLKEEGKEVIIVSQEIGNGVVPVDKEVRIFRDKFGKLQIKVAALSDEVIRVICGLGQKLK